MKHRARASFSGFLNSWFRITAIVLSISIGTNVIAAGASPIQTSVRDEATILKSLGRPSFTSQALTGTLVGAQFLNALSVGIRTAVILLIVAGLASQSGWTQTRPGGQPQPGERFALGHNLFDQNKIALQKAGFMALSGGYYVKGTSWLIKLQPTGELSKILFSRDWAGLKPETLKAVEFATVPGRGEEKWLQLIDANGRMFYSGSGGSGSGAIGGSIFTDEEQKTGTPLLTRLRNIGAVEENLGSGVYVLKVSEDEIVFLYRNERIEFIGQKSRTININPRTRVVGTGTVKSKRLIVTAVSENLRFEGPELRYTLNSYGEFPEDSVVEQITPFNGKLNPTPFSEIVSGYNVLYRDSQTNKILFTAEDPSGFHIGGTNSNEVIRSFTSLSGVPVAELDQRARPEVQGYWWKGIRVHLLEWNTAVMNARLRHDQLAAPLFHPIYFFKSFGEQKVKFVFPFNGQKFQVTWEGILGARGHHVFDDDVPNGGQEYSVTNLNNGKTLKYPDYFPYWVAWYGFYLPADYARPHPPAELIPFFGFHGPASAPQREPTVRPQARPLAGAA